MADLPPDLGHTSFRKLAHVEICLEQPVEAHVSPRWEDIHLIHRALPDLDWEDLDTRAHLFGRSLDLPLISAAMTGGHPDVRAINETIARAAQKLRFGIGIGSQRAAIEKNIPYVTESFAVVRDLAPDTLIIGNLGAAQFSEKGGYTAKEARQAVAMVAADALAIHVNPAQEVIQLEGDKFFRGAFSRIQRAAEQLSVPVIVKEVGSGFGREEAAMIENSNLAGVDIGGLGGTSWIGVEALRALEKEDRLCHELGRLFWDWGIPTAISIAEVRSQTQKTLIATGGVRSGLHAAKALALGADAVGMALPFLKQAQEGQEAVEEFVAKFQMELKTVMFITGCRTIADLKKAPFIVTGFSREWLMQRGIDFPREKKRDTGH